MKMDKETKWIILVIGIVLIGLTSQYHNQQSKPKNFKTDKAECIYYCGQVFSYNKDTQECIKDNCEEIEEIDYNLIGEKNEQGE